MQITAIEADDVSHRKIEWIREIPTVFKEQAESLYQRILHARDDEYMNGNIEKRDGFEACPIDIDSNHPLW
jgi:hypothetical protein